MNTTHVFRYSARELRTPLTKLIGYLDRQLKKLEPQMVDAAKVVSKRSALAAPLTDAEQLAARVVHDAKTLKVDRARSELWLIECDRVWPWKKFDLDETELRWLYRYRADE